MPLSCDDLARHLEGMSPGERLSFPGNVMVERHGSAPIWALVDTDRKDALHHPGDARQCAEHVLAEGARRQAVARQRAAAQALRLRLLQPPGRGR
jgi:hypothetical protein